METGKQHAVALISSKGARGRTQEINLSHVAPDIDGFICIE